MLSGWGVRPNDHEIEFGVAHRSRDSLALDAQYTGSLVRQLLRDPESREPVGVLRPVLRDGPFDSGCRSGNQICQLYDLNPTRFSSLNDNLITKAETSAR